MASQILRADIVIVAASHNPSIISPDWIQQNQVLDEEPKNFIHTPPFSMYDSENFQLLVDENRLQLTVKRIQPESLKKGVATVSRYVQLLPHVPYRALGLNFTWQVACSIENRPRLEISHADIHAVLHGYEIRFGGIIYGAEPDHQLKLVIEDAGGENLSLNFNFHYEISGIPVERILDNVRNFERQFHQSREIVERLFGDKKEG